jgi:hypothetical protein
VNLGGQIVYLLEVTNNGPSAIVGGVTLTDNLPRPSLFMAALDQAQEAAPKGSAATGAGSFTLNGSHTLLGFEITVDTAALSGTITAAHIHSAAPGVDGPPVRTLSFSGGTSAGVWTSEDSEPLTPTLVDELLSGNLYVNVHTGANPGGEIRGQIVTNTAAAGITFVSANASQGAGCSETNGVVTCGLGDLLGGASATVTIVVAVDPTTLEETVLTNFAIVTSAAVDTDPANDSATTTTTVRAPILVCGDLHPPGGGDGDVDILDALRTLQIAVNLVTPDARERAAGDVRPDRTPGPDGDGKIDVLEPCVF